MSIRVYNTLSREKEDFVPLEDKRVRMYVCGPTVYASAHIGHAMSYILFDAIRRYLEYRGYDVRHVQNFTDVDDKIINRANQEGIPPTELAERYIREFLTESQELNLLPAHVYPRASREIGPIISIIETLIEQGHAYVVEGDVYFRVTSKEDYGKLSHRTLEEMQAGERVEVDVRKEHPMDFALWKSAKPGEPAWESPWGPGRPGWHIECSAMSATYLGPQIDIHGGGQDLIFPHHENEIAQSECCTGEQPFVRYWLHNGLLQMGGQKMAKSVGNLITIRQILDKYDADALRLFVLSSYYRRPLTYTEDSLPSAARAVERIRTVFRQKEGEQPVEASQAVTDALLTAAHQAKEAFVAAMDDDFNTAQAIGYLFDLVREINRGREQGASAGALVEAKGILAELAGVLGFRLEPPRGEREMEAAPFIDLLIAVRAGLRSRKQWDLADDVRNRLAGLGVTLEDKPDGTIWRLERC